MESLNAMKFDLQENPVLLVYGEISLTHFKTLIFITSLVRLYRKPGQQSTKG